MTRLYWFINLIIYSYEVKHKEYIIIIITECISGVFRDTISLAQIS